PRKTWDELILPTDMLGGLRRSRQLLDETPARILVFEGSSGAGKRHCAAALCGELGLKLLVVNVEAVMTASIDLVELSVLLAREQRLCDAGIFFHKVEAFFDSERHLQARARSLARSFSMLVAPVVLACEESVDLKALLAELPLHRFHFPVLPFSLRRQVWE